MRPQFAVRHLSWLNQMDCLLMNREGSAIVNAGMHLPKELHLSGDVLTANTEKSSAPVRPSYM